VLQITLPYSTKTSVRLICLILGGKDTAKYVREGFNQEMNEDLVLQL